MDLETVEHGAGTDAAADNIGEPIFYEELPLRVRLLDFNKHHNEFNAEVLAPIDLTANSSPPNGTLKVETTKISYDVGERSILVDVVAGSSTDHFELDRDFPFLVRQWKARDGSTFKLTNSLRADFWNYMKNGDRERALKDPMLRHPD